MKFKKSFLCLLLLLIIVKTSWANDEKPVQLRCDDLQNPLGIDDKNPLLSWKLISQNRNQFQKAYEINVFKYGGKGAVWKSGKVNSSQNYQISYHGAALQSFTKYVWKVRWYNQDNQISDWSDEATFETAALQPSDWQAKWIGDKRQQFVKDEDFYQADRMPVFRRKLQIQKKISSARLYISGLGYSEVYLNNKKVGDHMLDPGFTAYRKQALFVTYDIKPYLHENKNTLGIMLGNGWWNPLPLRLFGNYNIRNFQETGKPCVMAQIIIQYQDGTKETIITDESWQTAFGPIIKNSVYLGEDYDAQLEKSFDEDLSWENAVVQKGPSGTLSAQMQPPIKITRIVKPIGIREIGKDTFVVDMGQNFAGVARIKVKGKAGTRINLRYAEITHPNGAINWITTTAGHIKEMWNLSGGPGAPKTAWQQDTYTLKGEGIEVWNPRFTFHAFRYVEITGWPGTPSINDIEGLRINSDVERIGTFSCSNDFFNVLHDKIQWTFLSNIFSVQSDCPGREKMGYGADIVATAGAYLYNYDMGNFYRKTIQDFENDQQPNGAFTEIAPYTGIADRGYGGESGPLGWQLAFSYLQKKLYDQYGDKRIIEKHYPSFVKQLNFLQANAKQGLYHWDIGDHEALDPRAEAFSAACFYYHHALLAKQFASILKIKDDSVKYTKLSNSIKNNIIRKYLVPTTGRFDNATQGAQIFALWYDLSPEKEKSFDVLMQEFARHKWHVATGIFSTMMIFDLLRESNQNDIAYKIANQQDFPGWGYMLANDATTLWESWEKPSSASYNHPMFGSIDEWFYRSLLGINSLEPGFKKIQIKPQPAELSWAKGSYESIHGTIESEWKKSDHSFDLNISIPVNTTAEVYVLANDKSKISESDKTIYAHKEFSFLRYQDGYAVFKVGSGHYHFRAENPL